MLSYGSSIHSKRRNPWQFQFYIKLRLSKKIFKKRSYFQGHNFDKAKVLYYAKKNN